MSVASQIRTLLKASGNLSRTPRESTIDERLSAGEYLYVTTTDASASPSPSLRDQDGNAVTLSSSAGRASGEPTVVGVIMARKLNWYLGEVRHLAVTPEFRNRGLGQKLFEMAEARLKTRKARVIISTDASEDPDATAEKFGFEYNPDFVFTNSTSGRDVSVLTKTL